MSVLGLVALLLCLRPTYAIDNIRALINFVNELEQDVSEIKLDLPRLETRTINKIGMLELVLRADLVDTILPAYIDKKVKESLTKILAHQSVSAIFTSHLRSEVRHLKHGFQERIRHFQALLESERDQQRHEAEKLRLEVVAERQYYDKQVNHLHGQLIGIRRDLGQMDQAVSFLLRQSIDRNQTRRGSESGRCGCERMMKRFDRERYLTDQKLKVLERNVSSLRSIVGEKEEEDSEERGGKGGENSEEEEEESSEEDSEEVSEETMHRLEKVEEDTHSLGQYVNTLLGAVDGKLQDVSNQCRCAAEFVPLLSVGKFEFRTEFNATDIHVESESNSDDTDTDEDTQEMETEPITPNLASNDKLEYGAQDVSLSEVISSSRSDISGTFAGIEATPTVGVLGSLSTLNRFLTPPLPQKYTTRLDQTTTTTASAAMYESLSFHPKSIGLEVRSSDDILVSEARYHLDTASGEQEFSPGVDRSQDYLP